MKSSLQKFQLLFVLVLISVSLFVSFKIFSLYSEISVFEKVQESTLETLEGGKELERALSLMEKDWNFLDEMPERKGGIFVGTSLYLKKGERLPINLYEGDPVHSLIPNSWFLKYGIDITLLDAPNRDEDGDGFSNREEYLSETNPKEKKSYPPLISRLRLSHIDVNFFTLKIASEIGNRYKFSYADSFGRENKTKEFIREGETFFSVEEKSDEEEVAIGRFRFAKIVEKESDDSSAKMKKKEEVAMIEDQSKFGGGVQYSVKKRAENRFETATAIFYVDALDLKKFRVRENESFSLIKGGEKKFFLRRIGKDKVEIEFQVEGNTIKALILSVENPR